jgi:hypothetical protein
MANAKTQALNPRTLLMIAVGAIILIVAFMAIAASAYKLHVETQPMASLVGWLPAARVGSKTISYAEYLRHVDAQRVFLSGPTARAQGAPEALGDAERSAALERAIRIAAISDMADKAGLVVTSLDVDRSYLGLIDRAGTSTTPQEIHDFLHDQFGMDEASFKEMVVRPAILEDTLRQKTATETHDDQAFDKALNDRLSQPDVVRYVTFPSLANATST